MNIHLYLMHCENIRGWLLLTSWGMYGVVHWNMDELAHLKAQCWFLTQTTLDCTYLGELLNFYKLLFLIWKTGYLWAQNKVMCVKHSAKRLVHNGVEKSVAIIFLIQYYIYIVGIYRLPWWLRDQESACQCWRHGFDLWLRTIPWRRKWQPTPVFLPGKSHRISREIPGKSKATWRTADHGITKGLDST